MNGQARRVGDHEISMTHELTASFGYCFLDIRNRERYSDAGVSMPKSFVGYFFVR